MANIDRCWTCRSQVMQAWGNYGTVWPVVHEQLGLRPLLPDGELDVVPQVPPGQPSVAGSDIRLGSGSADVFAARTGQRYTTTVALHGLSLRRLVLGVTLPASSRARTVTLDGRRVRHGSAQLTNRGLELTVPVSRDGRGNFCAVRLLSAVMRPMRTIVTWVWAVAVVAVLLAAGAAGARGAALPRAELTGSSCRLAIDPGERAIGATAVMRPVSGTRHMAIRFDLLSRGPGGIVTEIRGGDLGQFTAPANPTLGQLPADVWRVHKLVVPLAAPGVYRLRAEFRWTGRTGRVLSTVTRLSRTCRQRELRPDLVVRSITVTAVRNRPDRDLYTALIANTGNSAAGPFSVLFAPADGSPASTRRVRSLAAHSQRAISFRGPPCTSTSSSAPTITADSALQVLDLNRNDNALVAACQATAGG